MRTSRRYSLSRPLSKRFLARWNRAVYPSLNLIAASICCPYFAQPIRQINVIDRIVILSSLIGLSCLILVKSSQNNHLKAISTQICLFEELLISWEMCRFGMLAYLARCPRYSNNTNGAVAVLFLSLPASSFYSVGASWNSLCQDGTTL